jgi:hypothetical protein
MDENNSLTSAGAGIARRNLRYIIWFYLLNLLFAWFGASGFGMHVHNIMDHSLYSDKLVHGFNLAVFVEMINRPEFGPHEASFYPATFFAVMFLWASLTFMPGVLLGYSSDHHISRDEFFRACGRNLWRFIRLFVIASVLVGVIYSGLDAAQDALAKVADKTNYERLPFITEVTCSVVLILLLTVIRIWFDLAQTDVVLRDQPAVRKSLAAGFRTLRKNFARLFGTYVLITLLAAAVLAIGIVLWNMIVPPSSLLGALLVSQLMMLLFLAARFWQRASAVAFYVKHTAEPMVKVAPVSPVATPAVAM